MGKAFRIGVMADSFQTGLKESIEKARLAGADGIQFYAVRGEMDPENLAAAGRKDLLAFIRSRGLVVSALCGDLGGHGFGREADNARKIDKSKQIMDLALDLDCCVVTTHIGVIPADTGHPRRKVMADACEALGAYAAKAGGVFAVETGPETSEVLGSFLEGLGTGGVGIGVNFDPANLVMVTDEDPVKAVERLASHIVHTHAKDGVLLKKTDPERIYNFFAEGGIEDLRMEDYFRETPLGEGQVDFPAWLAALEAAGYRGFLTIEREVGDHPEKDIRMAVETLRKLMGGKEEQP